MNPEKRFGQIEEILADVVIKVDRLADGQAKLLGHVAEQGTEINSLTGQVSSLTDKTETVARAVASLTIENQKAHQQINDKLDNIMSFLQEKLP